MKKTRVFSKILSLTILATVLSPLGSNISFAWYPADHEASITASSAYSAIKSDKKDINVAFYKQILCKASRLTDDENLNYNASRNIAMHGGTTLGLVNSKSGQNYVLGLAYLYHTAYLFKTTTSSATSDQICEIAKTDIETKCGTAVDQQYVDAAKGIVKEKFALSYTYSQDTNTVRAYKVLGFAAHLAGDIFAHRTMVPLASVGDTSSDAGKFSKSLFNTGDEALDSDIQSYCYNENTYSNLKSTVSNWKSFYRGVKLYYMEFKDIKFFAPDTSKIYEDNINFYPSRYSAAKYTVNYLISKLNANVAYIDKACLLPGANDVNYSLKSNNLANFYKAAGLISANSTICNDYSTVDLK